MRLTRACAAIGWTWLPLRRHITLAAALLGPVLAVHGVVAFALLLLPTEAFLLLASMAVKGMLIGVTLAAA